MTRTALCGAILSAAMAVGVSAQTAGQATPQEKQGMKAGTITVTGCLAPDTGSTGGAATGGATGTSGAKSEGYILKNVTASPSGGAAASASPIASEYMLAGGNKSELKKFENSKVEIRGKIEDIKAPTSPSGAAGAASATPAPRLHVDSVKQIAATCSN
jgi:hypothetical protein